MTLSEVASRWYMSSGNVMEWHVKRGGLRAERIGKQWFIALTEMTKYEQSRLLHDVDSKMKVLKRLRQRIAQPFVPPPVAEGRA